MKALGFVVFLIGLFVGTAWAARPAVYDLPAGAAPTPRQRLVGWQSVALLPYGLGLLLMVGGAMVARRRTAEQPGSPQSLKRVTPEALLAAIATGLDELERQPANAENRAELAERIGGLLDEQVPEFLDQRERLIERLGLTLFAQMIGDFASMERGLARAWSALTDSSFEEVAPAIARAGAALERARAYFPVTPSELEAEAPAS